MVFLDSFLKSLIPLFSYLQISQLLHLTLHINLHLFFDSSLTTSHHISSVFKSCFLSIRDLCQLRNTIDSNTAQTIVTSLVHSKVDYCNSLFLNLPSSQLNHLQLILNSDFPAVSKTPRFNHISSVLKSLHWLKIYQRIHYKLLSLIYKTLQSRNPSYLHNLPQVQSDMRTRSSTTLSYAPRSPLNPIKLTNHEFSTNCAS